MKLEQQPRRQQRRRRGVHQPYQRELGLGRRQPQQQRQGLPCLLRAERRQQRRHEPRAPRRVAREREHATRQLAPRAPIALKVLPLLLAQRPPRGALLRGRALLGGSEQQPQHQRLGGRVGAAQLLEQRRTSRLERHGLQQAACVREELGLGRGRRAAEAAQERAEQRRRLGGEREVEQQARRHLLVALRLQREAQLRARVGTDGGGEARPRVEVRTEQLDRGGAQLDVGAVDGAAEQHAHARGALRVAPQRDLTQAREREALPQRVAAVGGEQGHGRPGQRGGLEQQPRPLAVGGRQRGAHRLHQRRRHRAVALLPARAVGGMLSVEPAQSELQSRRRARLELGPRPWRHRRRRRPARVLPLGVGGRVLALLGLITADVVSEQRMEGATHGLRRRQPAEE
eukprot:scaffold126844_cov54-Phaeocystis_antarctica.AAC.1